MNKKKEIEEMAKVLFYKYSDNICHSCGSETSCRELGYDECGICSSIARDLQDAGYGDVKQAVKEFVGRFKTKIVERCVQDKSCIERLESIGDIIDELSKEYENTDKELNKVQFVEIEDCDEYKPYRDLITDLQNEIDELHERIDDILLDEEEVKKQAVKEFAERLEKKKTWWDTELCEDEYWNYCVMVRDIDELLKEYEND